MTDVATLSFSLGEDIEMLRDTVRRFAADEIAPRADAIDEGNLFPHDLWRKRGDLGVLGLTVSEEYGGVQLGYLAHMGRDGGDFARVCSRRPVLRRAFEPLRQSIASQRQRRAEGEVSG